MPVFADLVVVQLPEIILLLFFVEMRLCHGQDFSVLGGLKLELNLSKKHLFQQAHKITVESNFNAQIIKKTIGDYF